MIPAGILSQESRQGILQVKRMLERPSGRGKRKIMSPSAKTKRMSPSAKTKIMSPSARTKNMSPAAKTKKMSPAAKTKIMSPAARTKIMSPAARTKIMSPAAKTKIMSPAAKTKIMSPAAKTKAIIRIDSREEKISNKGFDLTCPLSSFLLPLSAKKSTSYERARMTPTALRADGLRRSTQC